MLNTQIKTRAAKATGSFITKRIYALLLLIEQRSLQISPVGLSF
jgi:hypothetical protein